MINFDHSLWLPRDFYQRNEALRRAGGLAFVKWSHVADSPTRIEHLRELASSMRTESLLVYISTISIILNNTPWNIDRLHFQQRELAHYLCKPDVARRVERLIGYKLCDVIVHEEQLLIAAKLAIIYGQSGPAEDTCLEMVGELLLKINDLLPGGDDEMTTIHELIITRVLRRRGIVRNEQLRYLIPRYFDLLVTRSRNKPVLGHDLDEIFRKATGMEIEEYMGFAFLYYEPFFEKTSVKQLQDKDFLNVIRKYEKQFREETILEHSQKLFSSTRADLRASFPVDIEALVSCTNLPFQQHPLFRMDGKSAIPISLPLLMEKISIGIYWILHTYLSNTYPNQGVQKLTEHIGHIFQDYVSDLLSRTYDETHRSDHWFCNEQAIIKASPQTLSGDKPPFDGVIACDTSIILLEMFSGALPMSILEGGNARAFDQLIHRRHGFADKIKQLNNAIQGIINGHWVIPGINRKNIHHIYPVVVLLHPFPQTISTWKPLQDVAQSGWYSCGSELLTTIVHLPQILTIEELEMLEPLLHDGEQSLPALLHCKLEATDTTTMSMKTFILSILRLKERSNDHMLALYNEVTQKMREKLMMHIDFVPPETDQ